MGCLESTSASSALQPLHAHAAVVIPCVKVEKLTLKCVETCRQLFPEADIIVLADVPNHPCALAGGARIIVTGPVTIPAKRNWGARETRRRIVAFIDSDAYPRDGWLDNAVRALDEHPEVGAVAGPNVSPLDEPSSEKYVGIALRSRFCAHNAHYTKRPAAARLVDNMPSSNLIVRRDEYLAMGGMDEALYGGEDIEFCSRLVARGRKILYDPGILVYHKNRSFGQFIRQRFVYGEFTVIAFLKKPTASLVLGLLPAALVLFLLSGLFIPWVHSWLWVYVPGVLGYLGVMTAEVVRHSASLRHVPGALGAFIVATIVPGIGTFTKLIGLMPHWRKIYRNDL